VPLYVQIAQDLVALIETLKRGGMDRPDAQ
jgi:hypothetical protein